MTLKVTIKVKSKITIRQTTVPQQFLFRHFLKNGKAFFEKIYLTSNSVRLFLCSKLLWILVSNYNLCKK